MVTAAAIPGSESKQITDWASSDLTNLAKPRMRPGGNPPLNVHLEEAFWDLYLALILTERYA